MAMLGSHGEIIDLVSKTFGHSDISDMDNSSIR